MKVIGAFFLSLLVVFYGMPVRTSAQGATESFSLPDGTAGEVYRTNIESVLRDAYHLKLETDARASVFRWALAQGEMPPGLIIRGNGIIAGIPRAPRAEPYLFQARVLDISSPKSEDSDPRFPIDNFRPTHSSGPNQCAETREN